MNSTWVSSSFDLVELVLFSIANAFDFKDCSGKLSQSESLGDDNSRFFLFFRAQRSLLDSTASLNESDESDDGGEGGKFVSLFLSY